MSGEPVDQEQEEQTGAPSVSLAEWVQFVVDAAKRHIGLGAGVAAAVAVLGVTVAVILPPTYESSSKILVTQNAAVTPMLSNPSRSMPAVDPMRGVTEIVMRKENLESIVEEAKLVEQWPQTRDLPHRIWDSIRTQIYGQVPDSEKMKALVGILENSLTARPEDTVSIRIHVLWRDPQMAQNIAMLAQKKFLDARGSQEKAPISAAIDILEDELKKAADAIEPEFANVVRVRQKARGGGGEKGDAGAAPAASASAAPLPMQYVRPAPQAPHPAAPNANLSAKLAEIRQQERDIQEPWQRQLTEQHLRLSELKSQYGPAHPSVVQQEARVQDASIEPPTLVNLRQEEHDLLAQIETGSLVGGDTPSAGGHWVPRSGGGGTPSPTAAPVIVDEDPEVAAARAKLMSAIGKYSEVKDRLDAARIELTTADTAFKFRYVVVAEPELPRKPVKPNRAILILASIAGALFAGFLAGAARELLSGRVIEPWQVKQLGLPLLADVNLGDRSQS